jgi:hypothetical protein
MPASPQGSRIATIRLVAVAAAIMLAFLFTPKRDIGECVFTLHFAHAVKWPHNCDSPSIASNALNFERFVSEDNPWRTRPVYIATLGTLAHVLSPLAVLAGPLMKAARLPGGDPAVLQRLDRTVKRFFTVYLAAVVFNAGVLALMIAGAISLLAPARDTAALAIAAMLAASDIVAGWVWVPHPIMMNGLVPIGGALAYLFGLSLARRQPGHAAIWGLVQAAGCLTYGLALIWPVLTGLGAIHAWLLRREPLAPAIRNFAIFSIAVCLPLLLWFGSYLLRGQMVAYEAQSVGQFQWMGKALAAGNLPTAMLEQFIGMLQVWAINFRWIGWLVIAGFVLAVGLALRLGRPVLRDPVIAACLAALLCLTLFTYLQGYHQPRLHVPALSLVSLMTYRLLSQAGRERLAIAALGVTALLSFVVLCLAPAVTQT